MFICMGSWIPVHSQMCVACASFQCTHTHIHCFCQVVDMHGSIDTVGHWMSIFAYTSTGMTQCISNIQCFKRLHFRPVVSWMMFQLTLVWGRFVCWVPTLRQRPCWKLKFRQRTNRKVVKIRAIVMLLWCCMDWKNIHDIIYPCFHMLYLEYLGLIRCSIRCKWSNPQQNKLLKESFRAAGLNG